jgi:N utilization substance protein A
MKGSRIHGIVRELHNENIDVINYTNNLNLYISRALSPAQINRIEINEELQKAEIFLDPDQVSKAIGRSGLNIKLAIQLTEYEIDVYRDVNEEDEDDVKLEDFSDEIESWIIDEFKKVGLDTAKGVLALSIDELEKRTDLEEETIGDVLQILKEEFE